MKILYTIALFSLMGMVAIAQNPVQITGVVKRKNVTPVKLFKVEEGKAVEISTATPGNSGEFALMFYPKYEGLYLVGTGTPLNPNYNYKFYFKGGEKLSLILSDTSYVLTGKLNSKENIVLSQWHDFANLLEQKTFYRFKNRSTYVDFFPDLEQITTKAKSFLTGKATGNVKFDKRIKEYMKWDLGMYASYFILTPRSAFPSPEEFSPYYSKLKAQDFAQNTKGKYEYPWGANILNMVMSVNMMQQKINIPIGLAGIKNKINYLPNDTLKGDMVLEAMSKIKDYSEYQAVINTYGKYILNKSQQQKAQLVLAEVGLTKPGGPAFAFSFPDKNGKTVTMADLKGKVVLIDVWATWCGPCKVEIPFLKKLEEEMKGTDVQVVSISVDVEKDKETWQQMIKDKSLGGLQLFASGWGDFTKYYNITGIPRFMVFDREGKIVSADSPRPSKAALKALLEKTLAQKGASK